MTIEALNEQFGITGKVIFVQANADLINININHPYATASISLYGGQILYYKPTGQQDILWMSERSLFEQGKAIRGGIPVCFPWFGPHTTDKTKPQHGFARLQNWDVLEVKETATETISITLGLKESTSSLELWPHHFNASIQFIIGKTLEVKLAVTNTGNDAFEYSDALHTYFNIGNIDTTALEGLQAATYYDAFGTQLKTQQSELLYFNTETNRRYVNTTAACIIHDKENNRKISVGKTGSKVTVVWNPGEETTRTMSDVAPNGYETFLCVEPANAYAGIDMINLAPGATHTLGTLIEVIN